MLFVSDEHSEHYADNKISQDSVGLLFVLVMLVATD